MTDKDWFLIQDFAKGTIKNNHFVGFIIDSPWLPGYAGISTLDYYASDHLWYEANRKAISQFQHILFFPGFWSEFGMCTEPSAFGSKCIWRESDLPHAEKIIKDIKDIKIIKKPDPRSDGLLPLIIKRLKLNQRQMQKIGHEPRFAVARGPLNIASYLLGTTEFMTALVMYPEESHQILKTISAFLSDWLVYQKEQFQSIDGIFLLDDLVGFIGEGEFVEFALPYLKRIFSSFETSIRFFHNDASGLICSKYLDKINVNLFNFSFEHSFNEIRQLAGKNVVLMGNLPPRDILAKGTVQEVRDATIKMIQSVNNKKKIIWSCGGGMPPLVPVENIEAFYDTVIKMTDG